MKEQKPAADLDTFGRTGVQVQAKPAVFFDRSNHTKAVAQNPQSLRRIWFTDKDFALSTLLPGTTITRHWAP